MADNAWSYVAGQCTAYAAQVENWIPAGLGNAGDWLANAAAQGLPESSTPKPGDVVVYGKDNGYSQFGHVAVVDAVNPDNTMVVNEENYKGPFIVDTRVSNMQDVLGFIEPPAGAQAVIPPTTSTPIVNASSTPFGPSTVQTLSASTQASDWVLKVLQGLGIIPNQSTMDYVIRGGLILFGAVLVIVALAALVGGSSTVVNVAKTAGKAAVV